ncbi:MAG: hypothetical protein JWM44_3008 [Bacilli bacterium]|nr:hypothetical protein [Bacilli bacterium]
MSALATLDSQRKEMNTAIKNLLKTGELVCEDEDFARAEYLLRLHPTMMSIIKNYEWSQDNQENGMSLFELMNAEGRARNGEHGRDSQGCYCGFYCIKAQASRDLSTV